MLHRNPHRLPRIPTPRGGKPPPRRHVPQRFLGHHPSLIAVGDPGPDNRLGIHHRTTGISLRPVLGPQLQAPLEHRTLPALTQSLQPPDQVSGVQVPPRRIIGTRAAPLAHSRQRDRGDLGDHMIRHVVTQCSPTIDVALPQHATAPVQTFIRRSTQRPAAADPCRSTALNTRHDEPGKRSHRAAITRQCWGPDARGQQSPARW